MMPDAVTAAARALNDAILDEYIHDPHNIPESIRWAMAALAAALIKEAGLNTKVR